MSKSSVPVKSRAVARSEASTQQTSKTKKPTRSNAAVAKKAAAASKGESASWLGAMVGADVERASVGGAGRGVLADGTVDPASDDAAAERSRGRVRALPRLRPQRGDLDDRGGHAPDNSFRGEDPKFQPLTPEGDSMEGESRPHEFGFGGEERRGEEIGKKDDPNKRIDRLMKKFRTGDEQAGEGKQGKISIQDTASASEAIRDATAKMSSKEKKKFFAGKGKALLKYIKRGIEGGVGGDRKEFARAVTALVQAGEKGGSDIAKQVSTVFADAQRVNGMEHWISSVMRRNIEDGKGSLVAAHAAKGKRLLTMQVRLGFKNVRDRYEAARKARMAHDKKFEPVTSGIGAAGRSSIPDRTKLMKEAKKFGLKRADLSKQEGAAASRFASSMKGQAVLADHTHGQVSRASARMATHLSETQDGRIAVAKAMKDGAAGPGGWLRKVKKQTAGDKRASARLRKTVEDGAITGMAASALRKDRKGAARILEGAASLLDDAGGLADTLREQAKRVRAGEPIQRAKGADRAGRDGESSRFLNRLGIAFKVGAAAAGDLATARGGRVKTRDGKLEFRGDRTVAKYGSMLKAMGGLTKLMSAQDRRDYISGGLDVASGVQGAVVHGSRVGGRINKIAAKLNIVQTIAKGASNVFAAVDLAEGIYSGNADKIVKGASTLTAATIAQFAGKRAVGVPLALAFTIGEIGWAVYSSIRKKAEVSGASKKVVGEATTKGALRDKLFGDGPEARKLAKRLGDWASHGDGKNLDRLRRVARELGLSEKELAKRITGLHRNNRSSMLRKFVESQDPARLKSDGSLRERWRLMNKHWDEAARDPRRRGELGAMRSRRVQERVRRGMQRWRESGSRDGGAA